MYLAAPFLIKLLYTAEFLNSFLILKIALFSVIIKAIVFPIGYIVLVKGNKKLFFKQALLGDILNLVFSIAFYHFFGLFGLGLATFLNMIVFGVYIYNMVNKHYEFHFFASVKKLILINSSIGIIAVIVIYSFQQFYIYGIIALLFVISLFYSLKELNKRMNLKRFISEKINRRK
jgi:O-antigen/teichoic acid export membrane protein